MPRKPVTPITEETVLTLSFEDNAVLAQLLGEQDSTLKRMEQVLGISLAARGNRLALSGKSEAVETAKIVLEGLYERLRKGEEISKAQIDAAMRMAKPDAAPASGAQNNSIATIRTMRKNIQAYSHAQAEYIQALKDHDLVFSLGPAGTGKTYLAVAMAVHCFMQGEVSRIILSRPAVEAGEKLGFLPGDLKDKIDPYLRPLYDALFDMMPPEKVTRHMENGEIEVAPLAFMRGRTLSNAYIILDEAQNSTATQMKMFLTRLGENSRMVVTGDLSQIDLPRDVKSGLADATRKLGSIPGIASIRFSDRDVVRHDLAAKIVQAYEEWDAKKKAAARQGLPLTEED